MQFRESSGIGPVPALDQGRWTIALRVDEPEFILARLLCGGQDSLPTSSASAFGCALRDLVRPIAVGGRGWIEGFSQRPPLAAGFGSRPIVDILADVAVLRGRLSPAVRPTEKPPVLGVRPQFPVHPRSGEGDPRAPHRLVELFVAGLLDDHRLSQHCEVLMLLGPGGPVDPGPETDHTFRTEPSPLWRLLAPFFGQRPVRSSGALRNQRRSPDGVGGWTLVPVVPPSWPARLRSAGAADVAALVREAYSIYSAAGLRPAHDPGVIAHLVTAGQGWSEHVARRVLAGLMIPTRISDLAAMTANVLRLDQGANQ